MSGVRDQLTDFDLVRFEKLIELLGQLQESLQKRLWREEVYAEGLASMHADEYVSKQEGQGYSWEDWFESRKAGELQEVRPKVYFWAVRLHAAVGRLVARWLELFLPPAFPRVFIYGEAGRADVRLEYSEGRKRILLPAELFKLLTNSSQGAAALLFRALLLGEAVGGLVEKADLSELILEGEEPARRGDAGPTIDWEKVWEHYSAFADLETTNLLSRGGATGPNNLAVLPEKVEAIFQVLQKIDQTTEGIFQGQTAMMERQSEMEKATRQLLDACEKASTERRESCQQSVKQNLGELYDLLDDRTRRFLVSAEFGCVTTPLELDFSGAIVLFTKAFEHELQRTLGQFRSNLDERFSKDLAEMGTTLDKLTLGNWAGLLKRHSPDLTSCFQSQGLNLHEILKAIMKVNGEKMAKHPDEKGWPVAIKFRGHFLESRPSVLAALFRSRANNGMEKAQR
jgi:uncharacterized protein YukE